MSKKVKTADVIGDFFSEINSAGHSPRFQIITSSGILELFVNVIIELKCKNGKAILERSDFTYSIKLLLLHEKGLITDSQYTVLKEFNKLRNKAAHGSQFVLTKEMLALFKGSFPTFKHEDFSDPKNFKFLCYAIVLGIGGYNNKLFSNYFGPGYCDPR